MTKISTNNEVYRFNGYVGEDKDNIITKDICAFDYDEAMYKMEQYQEWLKRYKFSPFTVVGEPELQLTCVIV